MFQIPGFGGKNTHFAVRLDGSALRKLLHIFFRAADIGEVARVNVKIAPDGGGDGTFDLLLGLNHSFA